MSTTSSLDLLPEYLRGRLIVGVADLGPLIGWNPQSISRACRRGTFFIPSSLEAGSYVFRVCDVLDYVDSIGQPPKPKRGRPRKTEMHADAVKRDSNPHQHLALAAIHEAAHAVVHRVMCKQQQLLGSITIERDRAGAVAGEYRLHDHVEIDCARVDMMMSLAGPVSEHLFDSDALDATQPADWCDAEVFCAIEAAGLFLERVETAEYWEGERAMSSSDAVGAAGWTYDDAMQVAKLLVKHRDEVLRVASVAAREFLARDFGDEEVRS